MKRLPLGVLIGVASNARLLKIAAYTGFVTTSAVAIVYYRIQSRLKDSPFITESMNLLEQSTDAMRYLGKPITTGYLKIQDTEKNFCDGYRAQFEVPVKGVNNSGILYLWAQRENAEDCWKINRLELSPLKDPSKRLIIRKAD